MYESYLPKPLVYEEMPFEAIVSLNAILFRKYKTWISQ